MKIKKINYLGLNHKEVSKNYENNPKFVNYVSVKGFNGPMAAYYDSNPDRIKGHKDYLLFFKDIGGYKIIGIDKNEITNNERHRMAAYCSNCKELIYSAYRHDYNECSCGKTFVDGGQQYVRIGGSTEIYRIDIFEDQIIAHP